MRLFFYYAFHTFVNQIRKLLKTWVIVFILVCVVFGAALGFGLGFAVDQAEEEPDTSVSQEPEEEYAPHFAITDENRAQAVQYMELGLAGLMLALLLWELFSAEKSGGKIFLMADVNLLFSAPLKPQSVLIFRLITQLGALVLGFLYLLFQLPNLVLNVGIPLGVALMMFGLLIVMIAYAKLINVFVYTLSSTHQNLKRKIAPFVYCGISLLLAAYLLYWKISGKPILAATLAFFNGAYSRWIPVWGWIKLAMISSFSGNWALAFGCLALLLAGIPVVAWLIWHLKADFYEDAMNRSAEVAEKQQKVREGKSLFAASRKPRKDSLLREGFRRGSGASVFLTKTLYNRFRFGVLHFFTKTSFTYLFIAAALSLFLRVAFRVYDFTVLGLVLSAACFFRALGNPIHEDLNVDSFLMIPEKHGKKILYSMLGGTVSCALDLLPACVLGAVLLPGHWYWAPILLLLGVSLDFYSAAASAFIDLSLPVSTVKTIKTLLLILFIYFGMTPDAILIAFGFFTSMPVMLLCAITLNALLGGVLLLICPAFLENGRK